MSDGGTSPIAPGAEPAPSRNLRGVLERARTWTTRRPLIPMLAAGAALTAILVALLLWAGGPDYRVLYSNLSDADGGQIISALEQRGVPYKFAQGGHALLVPADKVYDLRLRLAEQGLPRAGNAGFEIMDKQPFGISQFAEQINYQRGLQGELATSIEALQPVENARVHLALPKDSLFVRERQPAKATVVLTLRPGRALGEGQVNAIVHLVSSSVRDLAPDNVTVVDQNGRLLTHNGADAGLDGTQLAYTHEVENRYQDRIENILAPILGAGNVHAQVTAQVDFNRREETQERYAPNQGDNPSTVRSRQVSTSRSDGAGMPGGVPGALTNTPPGAAASPINNPPAASAVAAADKDKAGKPEARTLAGSSGGGSGPHGDEQSESTVNYEVNRNITHIQHHQGAIQRLSTAVVVNYRSARQKDGSVRQVPLDAAAMKQVTELVRQAVGFSAARGDTVEVVNSAFTAPASPDGRPWWRDLDWIGIATKLGRWLLVLIAALVLWRRVLQPLQKRWLSTPLPLAAAAAPIAGDANPAAEPVATPKRKAASYEQRLTSLKAMAREDPGMVAMVVRSWMKRDGQ